MMEYLIACYLTTGYICAMWMLVEELITDPPKGLSVLSILVAVVWYLFSKSILWPYVLHVRNSDEYHNDSNQKQ